jgi:hypothetical protein
LTTLVESKHRGSDGWPDGFLAYGQISVAISGDDVNSLRTKRCTANSVQAGIDVRQGVPVVISLDGRAVGGGDLSTGQLKPEHTVAVRIVLGLLLLQVLGTGDTAR